MLRPCSPPCCSRRTTLPRAAGAVRATAAKAPRKRALRLLAGEGPEGLRRAPRARRKAAHDKARKACEGKQGDERATACASEMCAQSKDPGKCEAAAKEAPATRDKIARGVQGQDAASDLRACMREQIGRTQNRRPIRLRRRGAGQRCPCCSASSPFGVITGVAMVASGIPPLVAMADVAGGLRRRLDGRVGAAARLRHAGAAGRAHDAVHQPALHDVQRLAAPALRATRRCAGGCSRRLPASPTTSTACCSAASPSIRTTRGKLEYFLGAGSCRLGGLAGRRCAAGILIGAGVPASWRLEFAAPLAFIAMTIPLLRDRAMVAAALAAGVTVIARTALPLQPASRSRRSPASPPACSSRGRGLDASGRSLVGMALVTFALRASFLVLPPGIETSAAPAPRAALRAGGGAHRDLGAGDWRCRESEQLARRRCRNRGGMALAPDLRYDRRRARSRSTFSHWLL